MAKIISASIDVTKIDKSKLIKGKSGTYCNIQIILNDEKDQYGNDAGIILNQTKEDRAAGIKKVYLGNGKIVWSSDPAPTVDESTGEIHNAVPMNTAEPMNENQEDDLPF